MDTNIIITVEKEKADLITHNGTFHSDEVFSTVILKSILNKEIIKLCRTSDILQNTNALVYDVGGGKYDHHQIGGNGQRVNGIKYSSFGLIWRDFGKDFLQKFGVENVQDVWVNIDKKLVQTIDAVDNGQLEKITQYDFEILTIPNLITLYNSRWDEEANQDKYFLEAVRFAENLLIKIVEDENSKQRAKDKVDEAIEKAENQIMILDRFMPWKDILIESKNPKATEILYVIFPSNRDGYNVYCVPKEIRKF